MNLNIEIFSDMVCPWCYIGKRRLERVLRDFGKEIRPRLYWQAFELNPTLPPQGVPYKDHLEEKFGAWQAQAIQERLVEEARAEKIQFHFDKIRQVPNTVDAHRIARFAATEGRQEPLVEAIFRAYFQDGLDIGDKAVLEELALGVGLSKERVREVLGGEKYLAEVRHEEKKAHSAGINFVPCFIVNGEPAIRGAESAERMKEILDSSLSVVKQHHHSHLKSK